MDFLSFTTEHHHRWTQPLPIHLEVCRLPSAALKTIRKQERFSSNSLPGLLQSQTRNIPSPGSDPKPNKRPAELALCSHAPGAHFDLPIAFVFIDTRTLLQRRAKETFQENLQGPRHVHRHNHQCRRTKGNIHSNRPNSSPLHSSKYSSKQLSFKAGFNFYC